MLQIGISASADLVSIDGTLRYYDINGRQAEKIGLDVSFYNNQVDWQALRDQGFDFVLIRLGGRGWGTGVMYGDSKTQSNLRGAREAGLRTVGVLWGYGTPDELKNAGCAALAESPEDLTAILS